jgi:hypothetical protein
LSRPDLVIIGDCNPDVLVSGPDVTPAFSQQEKLVERMSLVVGGSGALSTGALGGTGSAPSLPAAAELAQLASVGTELADLGRRCRADPAASGTEDRE